VVITLRTKERYTNGWKDSKDGRAVVLTVCVLRGNLTVRHVRFEIITAVNMKITALRDVALCSPVEINISEVCAVSIFYNKVGGSSCFRSVEILVLTVTYSDTSQ
jgi:hypothetical protein